MTTPTASTQTPAPSRRSLRSRAGLVMAWLWIAAAGHVLLFGCNSGPDSTDPPPGDLIVNQELNDEQQFQNVISTPFRIIGGVIVYPLKLLFYDIPNAIADAIRGNPNAPLERLKDEDPRVRELGIMELAEYTEPDEAVKPLLGMLDDEDASVRRQALIALASVGDDSIETRLTAHVYDPNPVVRAAALYALGEIGTRQSLPVVRSKYADEDESEIVRAQALLSMSQLGDASAEAYANAILADADAHALWHANALLALGHIGTPDAIKTLMKYARPAKAKDDADPPTQDDRLTIAAITALGVAARYDHLLALVNTNTHAPLVRHKALLTLGEYGRSMYVPILETFLNADDEATRTHAIFGIALAGDPSVCPRLIDLLANPDPWARLWALTFLKRLTRDDKGIDPDPWRRYWNDKGKEIIEKYEKKTGS